MQPSTTDKKGFVILFAILIVGIIFALGAGLFSLAQKETLLSSTTSESQIALGVADTGMECALQMVFTNATDFGCAGYTAISPDSTSGSAVSYSYDLQSINSRSVACGVVTIDSANVRNSVVGTLVESRGFNICTSSQSGVLTPNLTNPLLIERKLIVWYANELPDPSAGGTGATGGTGGGVVVANPTGPTTGGQTVGQ